MANTLYDRIGAAHRAGASLGAAVDIGKNALDASQAAQAARAAKPLFEAGASFFRPLVQTAAAHSTEAAPTSVADMWLGNVPGVAEVSAASQAIHEANKDSAFNRANDAIWATVGKGASTVGNAVIRVLEWGTEATANYAEAGFRSVRRKALEGDWAGAAWSATAGSSLVFAVTDPEWREEWEKSVDARATLFQTLWAGYAELFDEDAVPFETMIDDPEYYGQRQEYFSSGAAMWATGTGDALWSIFADPLIFGGKAAGAAKAARSVLKADDVAQVAKAARGEVAATELTRKQRNARNLMHEFAKAFDKTEPGQVASAAQTKWLKNSRDGGAIAYMMRRAGEGIDDPLARIAAREEVLLAGMGDRAALAALEAKNAKLAVELQRLTGEIDEMRAMAAWSKAGHSDDAIREMFDVLDDSPLSIAEKKALQADVSREMDAIARATEVGTPLSERGVGDLAKLPSSWVPGAAQRDVARVVKTYQGGAFMTPVAILQGRHLPGTFRLSSEQDAVPVFKEAYRRARRVAAGIKDPALRAEYQTKFAQVFDDFVAAGDGAAAKGPRGRAVDQFNALTDEAIAIRHGLNPEQLKAVHARVRRLRRQEVSEVGTRLYKARRALEDAVQQSEARVAMVRAGDEIIAVGPEAKWVDEIAGAVAEEAGQGARPVLASQIEDWVSLVDPRQLSHFAGTTFRGSMDGFVGRNIGRAQRGLDEVWTLTETGLSMFNRVWKFAALLRPAAYFVRNQVDTQLRLMANMKPLEYLATAVKGASNKVYNWKKIDVATRDLMLRRLDLSERVDTLRAQFVAAQGDDALRAELKSELAKATAALERLPEHARPSGKKVRIGDTELARRVGLARGIDVRTGKVTKADPLDPYQSFDEWKRKYSMDDAEDAVLGIMTDQTSRATDAMRRSRNWDVLYGHEPGWEGAFLRAVNHQVRSDKMGRLILAGADEATVVRWLRETPEGRSYFNTISGATPDDAWGIAQEAIEHIDTLLPRGTEIRKIAQSRDLTGSDAKKAWELPAHRPGVQGERLTEVHRNPLAAEYLKRERQYFNWAATIPEGMMGRHPFYASRFGAHARRLMDEAGLADARALTPKQLSDVRKRADQLARRDVAEILFDTSRKSNLGHAMRFLSPFYSAWEDSIFKWMKIFGTHPETMPLAWKGVRSPNAAGLVVDRDGNRVQPDGTVILDDGTEGERVGMWDGYVVIPLPGGEDGALAKWAGADSVRVAKNSANVVFQGDPWFLPGPGPIVAIPTNELIVNMFPEWWGKEGEENAILKYILPFGPTDSDLADQVMPTWAQGVRQALAAQGIGGHQRVDHVWAMQYQEQVNQERLGLREELTYDERVNKVNNTVRNWFLLRLMGTQMPMVWSPQSRLQHYRDEWQRFLSEDPTTAGDRFEEAYPEYFEMTVSLSADETGLRATDETWEASRRYQNEIERNPQWGWFWAGAENLAEGWSQGVYAAQMRKGHRRRKDPVEAARDANVQRGWRDYHKARAMVEDKMEELGLTSLETIAARPLKDMRNEYIAALKAENPDWGHEFDTYSAPESVTSFLTFALTALNDHPELNDRGDMQALVNYIEVREMVRDEMRRRRVADAEARGQYPAPGTGSIDSHPDLRTLWDEYNRELIASDIGFEQMFTRVLERDDLSGATFEGGE